MALIERTGLPYILDLRREPVFPGDLEPDENGLIAVGGDLSRRVLVEAYSKGIFPWFNGPPIMWFSTDPRPVLYPDHLRISRRLERILRQGRFEVRFDRDFEKVVFHCGTVARPGQEGSWIDSIFFQAYTRLHYQDHVAHCVSVYRQGRLCGGLYGVSLGRVFFGESMFSLEANASKVALAHLCGWLKRRHFLMIDCQQVTPHILSLGAEQLSRRQYLQRLQEGLRAPDHHYRWPDE